MLKIKIFIFLFLSLLTKNSFAAFYTLDYPPFSCTHEQATKGISIHFVREVLKLVDIKEEIIIGNWSVGLEKAKKNEIDGIFPTIKTTERNDFLIFPKETLFTENIVAIGKNTPELNLIDDISKLAGKKICSGKGFSLGNKIDTLVKEKKIIREDETDVKFCLSSVLSNKVDYFLADKLIAEFALIHFENKENNLAIAEKILDSTPNYLAFTKKSKYIKKIPEIELNIKKLKQENFIKQLMTKEFKDCF
ncbi:transporter substrate-binding domain-containing protein [Pigmentibacter sp. JX0631]|uniref:substrate-binding periplasmic protein n=1 Tax=Pigmentibacter sp. JX0631 TaxID=2976982 RepID=UPI002468D27B|nr:transporter substrate-binding domain-containing protein [Pigmentibacter sp. JX0631]WGL59124.1 transporter substrate-binding domain-containing protein [Pigmentibacter sp. JX0631]